MKLESTEAPKWRCRLGEVLGGHSVVLQDLGVTLKCEIYAMKNTQSFWMKFINWDYLGLFWIILDYKLGIYKLQGGAPVR